jgi:TetR/AcrR family transcriptional regulator, transcriptional repressor for nem operon
MQPTGCIPPECCPGADVTEPTAVGRYLRAPVGGARRADRPQTGLPSLVVSTTVPTSMYIQRMDARERLIESTRELLWERGYVGTSPKAIQERSGAGQGSMYHHFSGKQDLALAAIRRNAADLVSRGDADLAGPGSVTERVTRYMRRERAVLRGCPVGRLTMDPDVMSDQELRRPVEDAFAAVRRRLAEVLAEGRENGELDPSVDPVATATALVAVLQGGYVLARAADSADIYAQAVEGMLALLAGRSGNGEVT